MWRLRLKLLGRMLYPIRTVESRRNWLVIGIFFLFVALTSRLSTHLFDTLRLTPEIGTALVFRVVAVAHLSFCIMLLFSSLVAASLILFANPENDLLYTLPISRWRVFSGRFFESMFATGWMVFLFGTPIAVGLGRSFVAGWDYVIVALLSLLGLIFIPTSLGIFLLCAAFVWIPRHRGAALLFSLGVLAAYASVSFSERVDIGVLFKMEFDPALHLNAVLRAIEMPSHPYTPDTLAAQALSSMARGDGPAAWKHLGLLWLENVLTVLIFMALSYPLFLKGWARNEQRETEPRSLLKFSQRVFRESPFLTLGLKDFKFFFRSITEWSQLLVLLTLIFVHIVNIRDLPLEEVYLRNFISFVNLAVSGLLIVAVSVRLVYPTFSLEGESAYLLKAMPLKGSVILGAKFWTNALPLLALSQTLLFISNLQTGVGLFFFVFSHAVSAFQTLAIVMLALHASLVMPPQSRGSLERAAGSTGGLLFMIVGSLYIVGTVAFFTAPIYKTLLTVPISMVISKPLLLMFSLFVLVHVLYYLAWARLCPRHLSRV